MALRVLSVGVLKNIIKLRKLGDGLEDWPHTLWRGGNRDTPIFTNELGVGRPLVVVVFVVIVVGVLVVLVVIVVVVAIVVVVVVVDRAGTLG